MEGDLVMGFVLSFIFTIALIFGCILLTRAMHSLKECQSTESIACPPWSCATKDPTLAPGVNCGIKPFRGSGSNKECFTYLSELAVPKGKGPS